MSIAAFVASNVETATLEVAEVPGAAVFVKPDTVHVTGRAAVDTAAAVADAMTKLGLAWVAETGPVAPRLAQTADSDADGANVAPATVMALMGVPAVPTTNDTAATTLEAPAAALDSAMLPIVSAPAPTAGNGTLA